MLEFNASRGSRSIFLEADNTYYHNVEFNDELLVGYANQIKTAFPTSHKRVDNILALEQVVYDSDEEF